MKFVTILNKQIDSLYSFNKKHIHIEIVLGDCSGEEYLRGCKTDLN